MKWTKIGKISGLTEVELKDNGEIYINNILMEGLSVALWDALVNHLNEGEPLSNLPIHSLTRRVVEAKGAMAARDTYIYVLEQIKEST